jgi:hypothetical protein
METYGYDVKQRQSIPRPYRELFKGENFMTPIRMGWFKLALGYAELSQGTGISHQPIFGVTVRPDKWEHNGMEARSRLFQSKAAAMEYIESLTEGAS